MKEVLSSQLLEMRKTMEANECITKTVPFSAIRLTDKSLFKNQIEVAGQPVPVSRNFFMRLATVLKMNTSLTREFIKNEDGKIASLLINGLAEYRRKSGNDSVTLIANRDTREVVDICLPDKYRRVSNGTLFDITERLLNDHSGLMIETVDLDPSTGGGIINILNNDEIGFPGAGKDEFFKFGFSIIQTSRSTQIESYNQRLVCSNGLRVSLGAGQIGGNSAISFNDRFSLKGTSTEDIQHFLENINEMKKANFVSPVFEQSLTRAVETRASLAEVEAAMLAAQRKVREDDPQFKKDFIDSIERNYFRGHTDAINRIIAKGHDPYKLNERQKSFIKTNMSVWDVVNSMTYLGSNNSGIELENKAQLKSLAGSLFGKGLKQGYDLQFADYAGL